MSNQIPYDDIQEEEFLYSFHSFCTFVSLMYDKKMNFATVFLKLLEDKGLRDIFISIIDEENDLVAIQKYIRTVPSITKSKYVTKFLNNFDGLR